MRSKIKYLGGIVIISCIVAFLSGFKNNNDTDKKVYLQHEDPKSKIEDIYIDVDGFEIPQVKSGEIESEAICSIKTDGKTIPGSIRIRGNSSRKFDKKSYLLKLGTEDSNENERLLGMKSSSRWVLNGPFLDRTMIRNYLAYGISREIMEYAPDTRYFQLYLNGEYKGLYLAIESIDVEKGKIDLTSTGKSQSVTSWMVRIDRDEKSTVKVNNYSYYTYQLGVSSMDILYPKNEELTENKKKYIDSDISDIERSLYSIDFRDKSKGYANYIDVDEFVKYFIVNEYFGNVDASRFSTYYYKDARGKVKPVVWDFNNGADNYIDYQYNVEGFFLKDAPWISQMLRDPDFVEKVIESYHLLRKDELSDENISNYIYDTKNYIKSEVDKNYELYGYVFSGDKWDDRNYLNPKSRNYTNYDESVNQLVLWLKGRGKWLDQNIESLRQYSAESKNAQYIIK